MRVGSIGFATSQGIGHLMRDFHRHAVIDRVLVVRHRAYENKPEEFYPDATIRYGIGEVDAFLRGLDALLLFETDLSKDWHVSKTAQARGIKVALCPMYEYTQFPPPIRPDLVVCPSLLDLDYYAPKYTSLYLPVPVEQRWRLREQALGFVHNAGHGQHEYAKGTVQLIEAMEHVKAPIRLKVRAQLDDGKMLRLWQQHKNHPRLDWEVTPVTGEALYEWGDVFINAEKWNGLSLPLQEAHAAGLVVMTGARYPATTWLPNEPMIPVDRYVKYRIPGGSGIEFDRAEYDPMVIAGTIDAWYGKDITQLSLRGQLWAEENSWERLKPRWTAALEGML